MTSGIRAASAIVVRWSPSAHACRRVPRVESPWGRGRVGRVPQRIKECRSIRAVPLEFRHADPVKFGELVAGRGLNAKEGTRPSLRKLVGVWSRSPDEPKAGRNQSLSRLIRLAPWYGSAAWAKCGGRRARPLTIWRLNVERSGQVGTYGIPNQSPVKFNFYLEGTYGNY
ncbi:hypothetical protein ACLB2K_046922 [Fragaria x ananassa]